jgi:hypothetical protein
LAFAIDSWSRCSKFVPERNGHFPAHDRRLSILVAPRTRGE